MWGGGATVGLLNERTIYKRDVDGCLDHIDTEPRSENNARHAKQYRHSNNFDETDLDASDMKVSVVCTYMFSGGKKKCNDD